MVVVVVVMGHAASLFVSRLRSRVMSVYDPVVPWCMSLVFTPGDGLAVQRPTGTTYNKA